MKNIAVIDDCVEIGQAVQAALSPAGVACTIVTTAKEAERLIKDEKTQVDLFIVDVLLPDGNGYSLLQLIRETARFRKVPVLFFSSLSDVPSKISAFALGADDYMTKPCNFMELRARVESKLRSWTEDVEASQYIYAGPLILDVTRLQVTIKETREQILLSSIQFRILAKLARHPEVVFSREKILEDIWGGSTHVIDRTVDTHVYLLRKKLGRCADLIEAVPGIGYRFSVNGIKQMGAQLRLL